MRAPRSYAGPHDALPRALVVLGASLLLSHARAQTRPARAEAAASRPPAARDSAWTTASAEALGDSTSAQTLEDVPSLEQEQREAEAEGAGARTRASTASADVPPDSLSHRLQVGVRLGAGGDAYFAVRYGGGPECGMPGETVCRGLGTGLLDAELALGVSHTAEVSVLARFGLGDDPAAASRPLAFGLGIRAYTSPHDALKLFIGGRAMLDATSSGVAGWYDVDFGLRGEFGLQVDFLRQLGAYAQLGAAIQFLNALSFSGDLTGGLQARLP